MIPEDDYVGQASFHSPDGPFYGSSLLCRFRPKITPVNSEIIADIDRLPRD